MRKSAHFAFTFLSIFVALFFSTTRTDAAHGMARLPKAALLTGYNWDVSIVTATSTVRLDGPEVGEGTYPSISSSGKVIGATHVKRRVGGGVPIVVAAVYLVGEKRWREFAPEFRHSGSAAISPDGAKLALARWDTEENAVFLHLIDVATGSDTRVGPAISSWLNLIGISWSPDGRRLAVGAYQSPSSTDSKGKVIRVVDLDTGQVTTIAAGEMPAWSPSGEWIAYLDHAVEQGNPPNRVILIRPDGSQKRALFTLPPGRAGDRIFHAPPVWSPDSTQLILNELYDSEIDSYDVELLSLSTMRVKRLARNVPPVYGWAPAG